MFKKAALAPLFDDNIFSATQVAHGKPVPDLYLFAASANGGRRRALRRGRRHGVKAAVAAGMAVSVISAEVLRLLERRG
jgi:beta-phosphoglucomutase-like phosphatase (HAD superfamily)